MFRVQASPNRQFVSQDFTEEENHTKACRYHPGQFTFNILPLRAHLGAHGDDMVLLHGWDCCHKDVKSHPGAVLVSIGTSSGAALYSRLYF